MNVNSSYVHTTVFTLLCNYAVPFSIKWVSEKMNFWNSVKTLKIISFSDFLLISLRVLNFPMSPKLSYESKQIREDNKLKPRKYLPVQSQQ